MTAQARVGAQRTAAEMMAAERRRAMQGGTRQSAGVMHAAAEPAEVSPADAMMTAAKSADVSAAKSAVMPAAKAPHVPAAKSAAVTAAPKPSAAVTASSSAVRPGELRPAQQGRSDERRTAPKRTTTHGSTPSLAPIWRYSLVYSKCATAKRSRFLLIFNPRSRRLTFVTRLSGGVKSLGRAKNPLQIVCVPCARPAQ